MPGKIYTKTLLLLVALGLAPSSSAVELDIVNAGFEDTTGMRQSNPFFFGQPTGWDFYDPSNIINDPTNGNGPNQAPGDGDNGIYTGTLEPDGTFFNLPIPEGDLVGILFGFGGSASAGAGEYGFEQELGDVLEANTLYELTVEVGNIGTGPGFNLDGFPGYRVELFAGDMILAVDNNSLAGSIPEYEFALSTVTFIADAGDSSIGDPLGIRLINLNQVGATADVDIEVDFDDVRLNATRLPEPGSLLLFAAGLVALGRRRRANLC